MPGPARIVRQAESTDFEAVRRCAEDAYAMYIPRIGKKPAPMIADFAAQIAAGQVHVCVEAGDVLGFIVLYPRGDHIHVENVAVQVDRQGEGVGRLLLAQAEAEADRGGFGAIELYTTEMMTENLSYYPRLGYAETGRAEEAGFLRVYFRKILG